MPRLSPFRFESLLIGGDLLPLGPLLGCGPLLVRLELRGLSQPTMLLGLDAPLFRALRRSTAAAHDDRGNDHKSDNDDGDNNDGLHKTFVPR